LDNALSTLALDRIRALLVLENRRAILLRATAFDEGEAMVPQIASFRLALLASAG
jgi:hypothetical protein